MNNEKHPLPVVGLFILNKKNQILIVKSYKWPGFYSIPGGKIISGETMKDALIREAKEEVGLDIKVVEFLWPIDAIYPKEFFKKKHFIFLDFLCKVKNNNAPTIDKNEIQSYKWVDLKESLKMNLEPYSKDTIARCIIPYFKGKI